MATNPAYMRNLRDALLQAVIALAAAPGTVNTAVIDTGVRSAMADFDPDFDACLEIPALNATMVPNTRTVTATITHSDSSTFANGVETLATKVLTGASSAGVAASRLQIGLPPSTKRYVRATVVRGASTGDASAVSATLSLVR